MENLEAKKLKSEVESLIESLNKKVEEDSNLCLFINVSISDSTSDKSMNVKANYSIRI